MKTYENISTFRPTKKKNSAYVENTAVGNNYIFTSFNHEIFDICFFTLHHSNDNHAERTLKLP
jgi:hypothetical protein